MKIIKTEFPGLVVIAPQIFKDSRGYFYEGFRANRFMENGITLAFVQDNLSHSQQGTLRGLHHQKEQTQGKLIWVIQGKIFDVVVDIRRNSPTFGKWKSFILDDEQCHQLYIPPGFAHGFYVLSDYADIIYKCTDYYHPSSQISLQWNDSDLNIAWPLLGDPILADKDKQGVLLKDISINDLPVFQS
jgi:dTDP-4-dehydrorhamnose 3,5-epimerase